ncbi:MAG: type II toxin-antitoxin system PemK/MazF family toxin [Acidimicrobiales bacterium]
MSIPAHGEVWWAESPDLGRRPMLVITRDVAIPVLSRVLVAPVTRTVRGIPTEVLLGSDEGLVESAASFDNLQPISRAALVSRAGSLAASRHGEICRALGAISDCW